ncbi:CSA1 [Candida albicans]
MYLVVKHSGIYSTMLPSIVISIVLASFVSAESSITEAPTTTAEDNPYTIYPSVAKTASINGFADRIYDQLPECAKPCMFQNTGVTPCPYWDTGCLCIMPTFAGAIGSCIAEKCKGQEVVSATSLGSSICSVAGVWDPYWMLPANVQSSLNAAATAVASSSEQPFETSSEAAESSQSVESSQPAETSSSEPAETSSETSSEQPASSEPAETSSEESSTITSAPSTPEDNPYTIYPSVAKTASINGFADRIYDQLPECAKPCMFQNTGVTPCPYWDTGCLCIMPTFAGAIGSCIAEKCKGQDVVSATSLGTSICSVAGVWDPYWMVPANVQSSLSAAATAVASSSEQPFETSSEAAESSQHPAESSSQQPSETASQQPSETASQQPSETASQQPAETSSEESSTITSAPSTPEDNPYTIYPSVAKTASINGFADRIYDQLPECAKPCMFQNTGVTPCPYWDTGCLCIMPTFAGAIGSCIAEKCKGQDVVSATSLGTSICSVAGVWDPYWMLPANVQSSLNAAATAVASSSEQPVETSSEAAESSQHPAESSSQQPSETASQQPSETASQQPAETSSEESSTITSAPSTPEDNPYTIYPSVAKTASINGFADRIYDQLPECAKPCMFQNTGVTPCPYWDTGCLCIMPTFAGAIGSCIAEKCKGQEVVSATSLGSSICSVAGVWDPYWMLPANVQSSLNAAATAVATSDNASEVASASESASQVPQETSAASSQSANNSVASAAPSNSSVSAAPSSNSSGVPAAPSNNSSGASVVPSQSANNSSASAAPSNNSSSAISESVAPSSYGNSTIAQPSTSTKSDAASITGPITTDKVITNESGIVFTSTVIITHVSEYCDQTSAAAVQSSACEEQSSAKSEQASASSEQVKVITSVVWCESSIQSIESVKTSAEAAHKTEVIASCASELSSLSSAKSEAMKTVSSLVEVQKSAVAKQTSLAAVQSSAASVQLSAAHAQKSSEAVEVAQTAVAEASKAGDEISTEIVNITKTVSSGKETGVSQATVAANTHSVAIANMANTKFASTMSLLVASFVFVGLFI